MSKANKLIRHMESLRARGFKYSMYKRMSSTHRDCSSAVFEGLIEAGVLTKGSYIGITDTLISMGEVGRVLKPIKASEVRAGDIFVMGRRGASAGAAGHTGVFYGNGKIIHCNYRNNGVTINPIYFPMSNSADRHFYRIIEDAPTMSTNDALKRGANYRASKGPIKIKDERATAECIVNYINIRTKPSTNAPIVDKFYRGMTLKYRAVYSADGYRWCEFVTYKGDVRYFAYRPENNIRNQYCRFY